MSKTKILMIAVAALFMLNVALLINGSRNRPPAPMNGGEMAIKNMIAKRLNFDEAQIKSYEALIDAHRMQIKEQEDILHLAKNKLYRNLSIDDQTVKQQAMSLIVTAQQAIEEIHYGHFIEIKNLCKGDQLQQFDELQAELGRLFNRAPPRRK